MQSTRAAFCSPSSTRRLRRRGSSEGWRPSPTNAPNASASWQKTTVRSGGQRVHEMGVAVIGDVEHREPVCPCTEPARIVVEPVDDPIERPDAAAVLERQSPSKWRPQHRDGHVGRHSRQLRLEHVHDQVHARPALLDVVRDDPDRERRRHQGVPFPASARTRPSTCSTRDASPAYANSRRATSTRPRPAASRLRSSTSPPDAVGEAARVLAVHRAVVVERASRRAARARPRRPATRARSGRSPCRGAACPSCGRVPRGRWSASRGRRRTPRGSEEVASKGCRPTNLMRSPTPSARARASRCGRPVPSPTSSPTTGQIAEQRERLHQVPAVGHAERRAPDRTADDADDERVPDAELTTDGSRVGQRIEPFDFDAVRNDGRVETSLGKPLAVRGPAHDERGGRSGCETLERAGARHADRTPQAALARELGDGIPGVDDHAGASRPRGRRAQHPGEAHVEHPGDLGPMPHQPGR